MKKEQKEKLIVVSACLMGENCKYNGGNNRKEALVQWIEGKKVLTVCPEVLGGLTTPRACAEIVHGTVMNTDGENVHEAFVTGADRAIELMGTPEDVEMVILQSRSPSCSVKQIYDGSFTGRLVDGQGVFGKKLKKLGYHVVDIEDFMHES